MTVTIKLSKKHEEIVNKVKVLENEKGCKLYFMYNKYSKKLHATRIDEIQGGKILYTSFDTLCTHSVATSMENKGILKTEKIGTMHNGLDFNLWCLAI